MSRGFALAAVVGFGILASGAPLWAAGVPVAFTSFSGSEPCPDFMAPIAHCDKAMEESHKFCLDSRLVNKNDPSEKSDLDKSKMDCGGADFSQASVAAAATQIAQCHEQRAREIEKHVDRCRQIRTRATRACKEEARFSLQQSAAPHCEGPRQQALNQLEQLGREGEQSLDQSIREQERLVESERGAARSAYTSLTQSSMGQVSNGALSSPETMTAASAPNSARTNATGAAPSSGTAKTSNATATGEAKSALASAPAYSSGAATAASAGGMTGGQYYSPPPSAQEKSAELPAMYVEPDEKKSLLKKAFSSTDKGEAVTKNQKEDRASSSKSTSGEDSGITLVVVQGDSRAPASSSSSTLSRADSTVSGSSSRLSRAPRGGFSGFNRRFKSWWKNPWSGWPQDFEAEKTSGRSSAETSVDLHAFLPEGEQVAGRSESSGLGTAEGNLFGQATGRYQALDGTFLDSP